MTISDLAEKHGYEWPNLTGEVEVNKPSPWPDDKDVNDFDALVGNLYRAGQPSSAAVVQYLIDRVKRAESRLACADRLVCEANAAFDHAVSELVRLTSFTVCPLSEHDECVGSDDCFTDDEQEENREECWGKWFRK